MNLVFFDTETGGLEPGHPTIQIAAIATEGLGLREVEAFEAKIRFDEQAADPEALRLNSYDPAVWEREAAPLPAVLGRFSDFLRGHAHCEMISRRTGQPYRVARLAGHNAAGFDGPRLVRTYQQLGTFLPAHPQVLDTLQLALWFTGARLPSYRLGELCAQYGIEASAPAHDALADVRMTVRLAQRLLEGEAAALPPAPG